MLLRSTVEQATTSYLITPTPAPTPTTQVLCSVYWLSFFCSCALFCFHTRICSPSCCSARLQTFLIKTLKGAKDNFGIRRWKHPTISSNKKPRRSTFGGAWSAA